MSPSSKLVVDDTVSASAASSAVPNLPVGEYFRPTGTQVSGRMGATTPYVRAPCPALNTLANHGYIPRDGKNVTHAQLRIALHDVYNLDEKLIKLLVSGVPDGLMLSDLSKHNDIEHDASLVHADESMGRDPAEVDQDLWLNMVSHATNDQLHVRELAAIRRERIKQSKAKPTGTDFGVKQRVIALGEAALLLRGLGGRNVESVSLAFAKSFLVDERIPAEFTKPSTSISRSGAVITGLKIQLVAFFQNIKGFFSSS